MRIRFSRWDDQAGMIDKGMMEDREIFPSLGRRAKEAKELQRRTGADHVLYGMTIYDGGRMAAVHFYMWPMNDRQFDQVASRCRGAMVYAIHK